MNISLLYQFLRFLLVIFCFFFIYIFLKYTFLFFYPFLLAIIFSFVMNPIVTYIENKLKIKRMYATILVVCTAFIMMSGLFFFIVTELIQGTTYLAVEIPRHFEIFTQYIDTMLSNKIMPLYQQLTNFFQTLNQTQQSTINDQIQQIIIHITTSGTELLSQMLLKIPTALTLIPYSIAMFFFTIMATFFITNDWYRLRRFARQVIPNHFQAISKDLSTYFGVALIGFLRAQCILISISTLLTWIGLLFLTVDHALTISLLIAFVDLLPLLGTGLIFLPWIGYLFFLKNYSLTIGLTILYMVIIVTRQILEPKILATSIGVNPLVALVIVFMSLQFWGVSGIIFAPLLLIFTNVVYKSGMIRKTWDFVKGSPV